MKGKRERYLVPALSFAIPGLVMLWVYASLGIAPFGDNTVLVSDMSSQYVDFFCALKHGDLFFSWSKALGTGYIGVISYYVSSPLSLLTLLVPNEAMPVGLALLTVLKIGLAGLSFSIFAQRRFPGCGTAALVCAVCYALMSYNAAYSLCIMWLDGVIWLPLILLALERILAGRGAGPYIAALTVCFLSTWYISYMIGIFCVLYLGARLAGLRPGRKALAGILGRFLGGAACALGLTAWMWLPTFLAMFNGKFGGGNVDYGGLVICTPLDLLKQLRGGQFASIGYDAPPYVFCGTAALVCAAAYFFLRRFPLRERLAGGALLGVLTASFLLAPLDRMWHLFQRPNWFPFRYAFLFSFFLLYLAVQALPQALERLKKRGGRRLERGAALALAVLTAAEMGWNAKSILGGLEGRFASDSYQAYREDYAANAKLVEAAKADAGDGFFRIGAAEDRGHNSPLSFGYPGITHYSSLYNYDVNRLTRELGLAQAWMWCAYYGSTPVTDALFGIRYVISRDDMPPGYEVIAQSGGLKLWKSPDALPLAFCPEAVDQAPAGRAALERQNNLLARLSGSGGAEFSMVGGQRLTEAPEEIEIMFTGNGLPVYADLSASGLTEVLVNGEHRLWLGSSEAASVHYLGTPQRSEVWTVTIRHRPGWAGSPYPWLWELDREALHAAVERLDSVEVTSVDRNGRVRLTASPRGGETLAATIPAENGWTAYVDGKKTEMGTWLGTFLALELPPGTHEVELRYTAPGLVPGIALGAVSLAGLAFTLVRRRRRQ